MQKDNLIDSKSRKISKKEIRKKIKSHIQYVRRNITQAEELVGKIEKLLKEKKIIFTNKETKRFEKLKSKIKLSKEILSQQEILYKEGCLPNGTGRIVSFHRKNIKPIYRGKKNNKTEFGLKVDFSKIGKAIILGKTSYDNYYDGNALKESIENFKEKGIKDKIRIADKGYSGQCKLMEENGIINGVEKRGKRTTPKKISKKIFKRERALIEASIGIFKNVFFGNTKQRAKTDNGDKRNVLLGVMGYNLRYAIF